MFEIKLSFVCFNLEAGYKPTILDWEKSVFQWRSDCPKLGVASDFISFSTYRGQINAGQTQEYDNGTFECRSLLNLVHQKLIKWLKIIYHINIIIN